jgi:hypothetical protein
MSRVAIVKGEAYDAALKVLKLTDFESHVEGRKKLS